MGRMPEEPQVEQVEQAEQAGQAGQAEPPPEEDWLEEDLPPEPEGEGPDWQRIAVIAGFIALIVAVAVFFVWTYLIPTGRSSGL
jgi:hypothetical protein